MKDGRYGERGSLGDFSLEDKTAEGHAPGIMGRVPRGPMGRVFDDIPRDECPAWIRQDVLLAYSRFLEETFRDFQLNAKKPSLVEPPFFSRPVDARGVLVVIPGGPYGPGGETTVVCHRVPRSRFRAVVTAIGHVAESAAAFSDLAWVVKVNGIPLPPWDDVRIQLWEFAPPTGLCTGIGLNAGDEVCLTARSLSATPHTVSGRLCGWDFGVRAEIGNSVGSTIVD